MNSLLCAAAIFFPLVMDCWEKGPLTSDRFSIPYSPVFADLAVVKEQASIYSRLPNPAQRSVLARELALSNNPEALPILEKMAVNEKSAFCLDDIFTAILTLVENGYGKPPALNVLKQYFTAESPMTRSTDMLLYLKFTPSPDVSFLMRYFANEISPFAAERVYEALRPFAGKIPDDNLESLYGSSVLPLKAAGAGLSSLKNTSKSLDVAAKAAKDSNPLIRLQAARGLAENPSAPEKLLTELAKDADPAVRLAAAGMKNITPAKEAVLCSLASDKSASVREAAAASLGTSNTPSSITALIGLIGDPDIVVRRAASDALVKLKPGKVWRDRLIAAGAKPDARREIISFFARLDDRNYAPDIRRFLKEADNDLLIIDAVNALGIMQDREAGPQVASFAGSSNPNVRGAVAKALGTIRDPETYSALKKLYRDKDMTVAVNAVYSMYQLRDNTFRGDFLHALGTRSMEQESLRAIAIRAVSDLGYMDARVLSQLNTLTAKACITAPMSPPMPDSMNVRLSGMIALLNAGMKGNVEAMRMYDDVRRFYAESSGKDTNEFTTEDVMEFMAQIEAFRKHEKIVPRELKTVLPNFTIYKIGTR